jgi:FkbM family methyltransferase
LAVIAAYYSQRLHLPFRWSADAKVRTPFGAEVRVALIDGDAHRQVCRTFSDGNTWNRFVPHGDVRIILDLGANRGQTALYWKARYPDAQIHGVEMDATNCASIRKLFESNRLDGNFWNVAICDRDGNVGYRTHDAKTRYRLDALVAQGNAPEYQENTVEVAGLTLRTFLDLHGISHADILKVDIEGAEQFLLDTCDQWSDRVTNLILEIHHNIDPSIAKRTLERSGFEVAVGDASNRMEWWCVRK